MKDKELRSVLEISNQDIEDMEIGVDPLRNSKVARKEDLRRAQRQVNELTRKVNALMELLGVEEKEFHGLQKGNKQVSFKGEN